MCSLDEGDAFQGQKHAKNYCVQYIEMPAFRSTLRRCGVHQSVNHLFAALNISCGSCRPTAEVTILLCFFQDSKDPSTKLGGRDLVTKTLAK